MPLFGPGATVIPPGKTAYGQLTSFTAAGFPPASSLNPSLSAYRVFGTFYHGHTLMRRIWAETYRNGVRLLDTNGVDVLTVDDSYDFDMQTIVPVSVVY